MPNDKKLRKKQKALSNLAYRKAKQAKREREQRERQERIAQQQAEREAQRLFDLENMPVLRGPFRYFSSKRQVIHYPKPVNRTNNADYLSMTVLVNAGTRYYIIGDVCFLVYQDHCFITQNSELFDSDSTDGMEDLGPYVAPISYDTEGKDLSHMDSYDRIVVLEQTKRYGPHPRQPWRIPRTLEISDNPSTIKEIWYFMQKERDVLEHIRKNPSLKKLRYELACDLGRTSLYIESNFDDSKVCTKYCGGYTLTSKLNSSGVPIDAITVIEHWDQYGAEITAAAKAIVDGVKHETLPYLVLYKRRSFIDTSKMSAAEIASLIHDKIVPLVTVYGGMYFNGVRYLGYVPFNCIPDKEWSFIREIEKEVAEQVPMPSADEIQAFTAEYIQQFNLDDPEIDQEELINRARHLCCKPTQKRRNALIKERKKVVPELVRQFVIENYQPSDEVIQELANRGAKCFIKLGEPNEDLLQQALSGRFWLDAREPFGITQFIKHWNAHNTRCSFDAGRLASILNHPDVYVHDGLSMIRHIDIPPDVLAPLLDNSKYDPIKIANAYLDLEKFQQYHKQLAMIVPTDLWMAKNIQFADIPITLQYIGRETLYFANYKHAYVGTPLGCVGMTDIALAQDENGKRLTVIPISAIAKRALNMLYPNGVPDVKDREILHSRDLERWCEFVGFPIELFDLAEWVQTLPLVPSFF